MVGFATSPVTRSRCRICMSAELVVEHLESAADTCMFISPDAAALDAQFADGHEPILVVVAQLQAIDQDPVALEHQARDRVA